MIKSEKNKKYSGMTVVEMLVSIAIFAMGIAGFTLLFMRVWQTNKFTIELGQSSMLVSQGVNTMIGYIREAQQSDNGSYPLVSADGNDFVLYSDYDKDGVVERLHFYKSGHSILMGVTDPTNTMPKQYPAADQSIITITNDIVNDNSTPIFYYYNQNYPADMTNNPMATPADIASIHLVKVYLQINIDPYNAPDNVKMQTFVKLRNLNE